MKGIFIFIILCFYAIGYAQPINQNADPAVVSIVQTPAQTLTLGETATICVRVTDAGTDPIMADKVLVSVSWSSAFDFANDNNIAAQGWTIVQQSDHAVTLRNTTDQVEAANLDVKDLCIDVVAVELGDFQDGSILGNIQRAIGQANVVGNTNVANDNVANNQSALPVELTYFNGKSNACSSQLEWRTESEDRNDHFEVQHSVDGKKFEPRVKIKGAGTTVMPKVYEFMDTKAVEGINYYRLKQVDEDGYYEYFSVIAIDNHCDKERVFELYPSPVGAGQKLQVNFYTDKLETELIVNDLNSRAIKRYRQSVSQSGQNKVELDVSGLPAGMYFITDEYGNQRKFVKADY